MAQALLAATGTAVTNFTKSLATTLDNRAHLPAADRLIEARRDIWRRGNPAVGPGPDRRIPQDLLAARTSSRVSPAGQGQKAQCDNSVASGTA